MLENYIEAANKISELAEACDDPEIANILRVGHCKILNMAKDLGLFVKVAACENKEEQTKFEVA